MTYSVIAAEPGTGRIGAAIASRFLAVGSYCLYLDPAAGVVVSQGLANPVFGARGLAALAEGTAPAAILERLLANDPHAEHRQTHLMNLAGEHAARTGDACGAWAGALAGDRVSFAGNLLAGAQVLQAMQESWEQGDGDRSMIDRLLQALAAGEAAGGDWRGMQAAAIRVYGDEIWPELDLRVDDFDGSPVDELRRLYRRHQAADVQAFRATMPRRTTGDEPVYPALGDLSAVRSGNPGTP